MKDSLKDANSTLSQLRLEVDDNRIELDVLKSSKSRFKVTLKDAKESASHLRGELDEVGMRII